MDFLASTSRETFLEFLSISLSLPTPEVGQVKYIQVVDDTWSFWGKFLFEDCLAFFMAIRSENWELHQ